MEKDSELFSLIKQVLSKVAKTTFIEQCRRKSYSQRIKSTSGDKCFEAQLIKEEEFVRVMADTLQQPIDWRPNAPTLKHLREQVFLSPKYEKIYNLKLVH